MFDEIPNNQSQPKQPGNIPNNLPNNLPSANNFNSPMPGIAKEPEDILSGVDAEKSESLIKGPAKPAFDLGNLGSMVPPPSAPQKPESREPFLKQHKKGIAAVLILVIGIALLALAGWYGYKTFFSQGQLIGQELENISNTNYANTNQPDLNINANANINSNSNQAMPADINQNPQDEADRLKNIDTDRDGLSDYDEINFYGTDIQKVDSDDDGLTDRDEVKVFKTDPLNPDSDGDTYIDGNEVRAGYDPLGTGRLLKIEQTGVKLQI